MSEARAATRPVVGLISDVVDVEGAKVHGVRCRYTEALRLTACVTPVIIPAGLSDLEVDTLVAAHLDGILLTGASSNVCPSRYDQVREFDAQFLDPERDDLAIKTIRAAERHGLPLFGICRGLQELNVAYRGSLHQALVDRDGAICHEEDCRRPRDEQYSTSHHIRLTQYGLLASVLQARDSLDLPVNSLHRQGIDRLGEGLSVEAEAPDGLIEAVSVPTSRAPIFAVQWHPEWFHAQDPVSGNLFRAFGTFCRIARTARDEQREGILSHASH